jgi:amino acid transporter
MSVISEFVVTDAQRAEKGLKQGALGLISSTVVGVASTAPAYSLAATLGFVVVLIGVKAPIVTLLAFVPMLLISFAYNELNKADPDCGTVFTWGTRAFGPKTGWMGGWGLVAADILVMASLAQIAGQYIFLLFNAKGIGGEASSGWVLLVGILWLVAMTAICYVGIEISANFQKALLGIEVVMLVILSVVALVKVADGSAPIGHLHPTWAWFNPLGGSFKDLVDGLTLMLFIYWGWDTGFGSFLTHLLLLMVLSSAAASTQTTILPTARTTLSMAVYKSIPSTFARIHRRFLTPTVSTVIMGAVSAVFYVIMNYVSKGSVIVDSVTALGVMIAFYYGLTGLSCFWYYRKTLAGSTRDLFMRGVLPLIGWALMWSIGGYSIVQDWGKGSSLTSWRVPGVHWEIGGAFVLAIGAILIGVVLMYGYRALAPPFFRGEVLNRDTLTLVPDDIGAPIGLFGIDEFEEPTDPANPLGPDEPAKTE